MFEKKQIGFSGDITVYELTTDAQMIRYTPEIKTISVTGEGIEGRYTEGGIGSLEQAEAWAKAYLQGQKEDQMVQTAQEASYEAGSGWRQGADAERQAARVIMAAQRVAQAAGEAVDIPVTTATDDAEAIEYRKQRGDIGPLTYEYALVERDRVVRSGVRCMTAEWHDNKDPYADKRAGRTVSDITTDGFQAPGEWRVWAISWAAR